MEQIRLADHIINEINNGNFRVEESLGCLGDYIDPVMSPNRAYLFKRKDYTTADDTWILRARWGGWPWNRRFFASVTRGETDVILPFEEQQKLGEAYNKAIEINKRRIREAERIHYNARKSLAWWP